MGNKITKEIDLRQTLLDIFNKEMSDLGGIIKIDADGRGRLYDKTTGQPITF